MLSKRKQIIIRHKVGRFLEQESQREEDESPEIFNEGERREEAIGYCALELNLQESTVERWWEKFEMELI